MPAVVHKPKPEDSLQESVFYFHHVSPQVIGLGANALLWRANLLALVLPSFYFSIF